MVAITTNYPTKDLSIVKASIGKRKQPSDRMLTVVVGPDEKLYRYQPQQIVKHSRYLRTELVASLMNPRRRDSLILVLPHVSPSDWELMLKLIDPECDQKPNLCDAARLRRSFDRYGFQEGIKLCDEVLKTRSEK